MTINNNQKRITIDDWAAQGDIIPIDDSDYSVTGDFDICDICHNSGIEEGSGDDIFYCDCDIGQAWDTINNTDVDVDLYIDRTTDTIPDASSDIFWDIDPDAPIFVDIDGNPINIDDDANTDLTDADKESLKNWGWLPLDADIGYDDDGNIEVEMKYATPKIIDTCN